MTTHVSMTGRTVTVTLSEGHAFDFEVRVSEGERRAHRFAERWVNRRLPLGAHAARTIALVIAEQQLRRRGLMSPDHRDTDRPNAVARSGSDQPWAKSQ